MMEQEPDFPQWEITGGDSSHADAVQDRSGMELWIAMRELTSRLMRPFLQIRWKLTLSYIVVTVAALLVVEIGFLMTMAFNIARNTAIEPESVLNDLEKSYAQQMSEFLSQDPPNVEGMRASLQALQASPLNSEPILFGNFLFGAYSSSIRDVIFLTSEGELIDALPHEILARDQIGKRLDLTSIPGLEQPAKAALEGETDYSKLYVSDGNKRLVGAIPVFSSEELYSDVSTIEPILDEQHMGDVVGAIVFVQKLGFWEIWQFSQIARQIGISLLFITGFAALLGAIFGSITGRGLVERLREIFNSAHAWSQGDFSAYVEDSTGDELGQLAQGLNHMAAQLENLLDERQHMSVLKERNRLARDLHDSVKQQTFAASAQLAAAKAHFDLNAGQAHQHLLEAEKLLDEARQELTDLIHELRPVALQGRGLASAIRQYAADCSSQTEIEIEVNIQSERPLPLDVEQTLFRIMQGALANVARHSQATHAEIRLRYGLRNITLSVVDNGRGFDVGARHYGIGLRSMRERAEMIGGVLAIYSVVGEGTHVMVTTRCAEEASSPFGVI